MAAAQGDWRCPGCVAGGAVVAAAEAGDPKRGARQGPQQQRQQTDRQKFLAGKLELGRIEALWKQGKEVFMRCRWYCRPEDTVEGRQVKALSIPILAHFKFMASTLT